MSATDDSKKPTGAKGKPALPRKAAGAGDGEAEVRSTIAAMAESDRTIGERLHAIIRAAAPELTPRLWYGMPAYARNGKVVCFFQAAGKFKTRYATLGFQHEANLDDGIMWPTAFALTEINDTTVPQIQALVKKAIRGAE